MVPIELFMVRELEVEATTVLEVQLQKRVRLTFLKERLETTIGNHQEHRHLLEEVEEVADLDTENNYGAY